MTVLAKPQAVGKTESMVAGLVEPAAVVPKRAPWWGWSSDEEFFHGPFASREEAIADGKDNDADGAGFTTALCHPHMLHHPDYEEVIVEWLACATRGRPLEIELRDAFEGANTDHDYEGEVSDESDAVDWSVLAATMLPLLDDAIARSGHFVVAPIGAGMFEGSEAILDVLQSDQIFARDLAAVAAAWSDANNLLLASRMVALSDEVELAGAAA